MTPVHQKSASELSQQWQAKRGLQLQHHQLVKFKLYKSLVTSILLCGCKTWSLLADSEKGIQPFETKCMRILIHISYLRHKSKINFLVGLQEPLYIFWVRDKINFLVDPQAPLLATVQRQKLAWFGHVTRHDSLSQIILQGSLEGG